MSNPIELKNLQGKAASILAARFDEILREWAQTVRAQLPPAAELAEPIIIDTLPGFLTNLAQALATNHPRGFATESNTVAEEHGGERARVTRYGPEQVMQEYSILRAILERTFIENGGLSVQEAAILHSSFDQAIQEAMMAYFMVHQRIRNQFIASLSHDLRNPLGAAKMAIDLILREAKDASAQVDPEDVAMLASRASINLKRVDRMIQNLLDSNLLHFGERLSLSLQDLDMYAVVGSVVDEFPDSQRKRIILKGGPVPGIWDRDHLFRAFENLVSNAFKYGDPNGDVTIAVAEQNGRAIVSVHNVGNPIPAEDREHLFQAFRRSASAKASRTKGWGIGLAQVRGVAESHGGSLSLDSSVSSGTTFLLDIPVDARPFVNAPVS